MQKRLTYVLFFILGTFFLISVQAQNVTPFGKMYVVSTQLSNGESYKQTWSFDSTGKNMSVTILDGTHKGLKDSLVLYNYETTPGVWFINWLALSKNAAQGNTISYVVDFNQGKVWGFFTNNAKKAGGVRPFETATGTIQLSQ